MANKNFPPSSGDSSKPVLALNQAIGETGPAAIYAYPATPVIPIPSDSDGSNPDYTNNSSEIYIYQGGNLLTGWTIAYISGTSCIGTVNNAVEPRTIAITSVTADSGYADFTATLSGTVLRFRVYFSKVKQGAEGATGATGTTGAQGATGVQGDVGQDGTGLVMKKFSVNVRDPYPNCTGSDNGGLVRLTFLADPGLEVGEAITLTNHKSDAIITVKQSSLIYDTNLTYAPAYLGSIPVWSMRYFRKGHIVWNDQADQILSLPGVFPFGAKMDEIAVFKVDGNNDTLFWDVGDSAYPSSGYDRYIAAQMIQAFFNMGIVNLWDPSRYGYNPTFITTSYDARHDVYLRCRRYSSSQNWDTTLAHLIYEVYIAYKHFPTLWDGSGLP